MAYTRAASPKAHAESHCESSASTARRIAVATRTTNTTAAEPAAHTNPSRAQHPCHTIGTRCGSYTSPPRTGPFQSLSSFFTHKSSGDFPEARPLMTSSPGVCKLLVPPLHDAVHHAMCWLFVQKTYRKFQD